MPGSASRRWTLPASNRATAWMSERTCSNLIAEIGEACSDRRLRAGTDDSPRVLEAGGDPVDCAEHPLEVGHAARIPGRERAQLPQQPHLQVTHRVDVGVAQAQADQQLRLPLEHALLLRDLEDHGLGLPKLRLNRAKEALPFTRVLNQAGI